MISKTFSFKFVRDYIDDFELQYLLINWRKIKISQIQKSSFYAYILKNNKSDIKTNLSSHSFDFKQNENESSLFRKICVNMKTFIIRHRKLSSFFSDSFDEDIETKNVIDLNNSTLKQTSKFFRTLRRRHIFHFSCSKTVDKFIVIDRVVKIFFSRRYKQKRWHVRRFTIRFCHFDNFFFLNNSLRETMKRFSKSKSWISLNEFAKILIDDE